MISRYPKFLPEDGSIPKAAKYHCKTCKQWWSSSTGKYSHLRNEPDHVVFSTVTNQPVTFRKLSKLQSAVNRNGILDASARDLLLDYVLGKAKDELNAELDRMFRELKSQPITKRGQRKVYVA